MNETKSEEVTWMNDVVFLPLKTKVQMNTINLIAYSEVVQFQSRVGLKRFEDFAIHLNGKRNFKKFKSYNKEKQ